MTADKPDSMVARMNKKYADELSPDSRRTAEFSRLVKEMAQHTYQIRHQFGVDFMASFDEYHQKSPSN